MKRSGPQTTPAEGPTKAGEGRDRATAQPHLSLAFPKGAICRVEHKGGQADLRFWKAGASHGSLPTHVCPVANWLRDSSSSKATPIHNGYGKTPNSSSKPKETQASSKKGKRRRELCIKRSKRRSRQLADLSTFTKTSWRHQVEPAPASFVSSRKAP